MSDPAGTSAAHIVGAHLEPAPCLHRWSVRVRPADRQALEGLLGISLPAQPLRAFHSHESASLWLGPDEWLVLMPPAGADAFRARLAQLAHATAPPSSIVEITHRNVGIVLSGAGAPWVLNAGCPLNLSAPDFPPDACTRTVFHKVEIVVWRQSGADSRYHIECWRSHSRYIWKHLVQAAAEYVVSARAAETA